MITKGLTKDPKDKNAGPEPCCACLKPGPVFQDYPDAKKQPHVQAGSFCLPPEAQEVLSASNTCKSRPPSGSVVALTW